MDRLVEGYRRFHANAWREHEALYDRLSRGQSPRAIVIGCSDSRVDPQLIFDAAPGELFVVRNVANLVPPYAPDAAYHGTSAALEFGVRALAVRHIVVLGHAQCGGIHALLHGAPKAVGDFVEPWMAMAAPARERARAAGGSPQEVLRRCEHESIKVSLQNLASFPWIRDAVDAGSLQLHGYYFDVADGSLLRLDGDGTFKPV